MPPIGGFREKNLSMPYIGCKTECDTIWLYIPRRDAPEVMAENFRPLENRGRGECRMPSAPAASCALLVVSMRTSIHSGGTGNIRHSPRNGFNGFLRALPGDEFLLPPSPRGLE